MAEIINLNIYRKKRKRTDDSRQAAESRIRHGRTKAVKNQQSSERLQTEQTLDGKRIEKPDDDQEPA